MSLFAFLKQISIFTAVFVLGHDRSCGYKQSSADGELQGCSWLQ